MSTPRPNTAAILAQLKDFQRDTVDYVFRRMYLDEDCSRRFLVADEVGLGKTLIARGVIARAIDHLWTSTRRIDVVYVCSNADIARQNINRLNVTGKKDFELASRITLLPITLPKLQQDQKLNFVSFTPSTSFEQGSGSGWSQERQLLYWLLRRCWQFSEKKGSRVLQGWTGIDNFRAQLESFRRRYVDVGGNSLERVHDGIAAEFCQRVDADSNYRNDFFQLCDTVPRAGVEFPKEVRRDTERLIGRLRKLLAETCLHWLEPDVIILDEFQRFKQLLSKDSDAGEMAHALFDYQQSHADPSLGARVLLLSATPYKMYTLSQESGQEDHYADFQNTLDFLLATEQTKKEFRQCVQDYREALYRLADQGMGSLVDAKTRLEAILRRVMVRTERLALGTDRNGMLRIVSPERMELAPRDVEQYLAVQRVARAVGHDDVLEYWKSAPYLLNFMEDYELKRKFDRTLDGKQLENFRQAMQKADAGLLSRADIVSYQKVDPANVRLRCLLHDTVDRGAWKLLWIPPSLPYYAPKGPFAEKPLRSFTKRLVFSCWKVVPKAIAALASYEAERNMMLSYRKKSRNTPAARKKRRPLLRFAITKGRLTGMPALMLVYPSSFLAKHFDPLRLAAEQRAKGQLPDSNSLLDLVKADLVPRLASWISRAKTDGPIDESWYWAAPLLLDLQDDRAGTTAWLQSRQLEKAWSLREHTQEEKSRRGWERHIAEARKVLAPESLVAGLGPPPPDLVTVLAWVALAGPAVCALRTLRRVTDPSANHTVELQSPAGSLAHSVLHLFNLPEVISYVRDRQDKIPYWQRTLRYCLAGNFQAMLDEYAHMLAESENLTTQPVQAMAETISRKIQDALLLRTSTAQADVVRVKPEGVSLGKPLRMRTRFAMRFGDQTPERGSEPTRADHVRTAFNSPFWPFVLATTSVGQEGLDFHPYCHAVVHWNLPSNPVDLEQREGRVHRYKGHALRKNIATTFAASACNGHADPWAALFEVAKSGRAADHTDLYPYWICDQGDAKIERHVPSLPHSRDIAHYDNLRRSLVLYRMVFGQNRQEDLMRFLESHLSVDEREMMASRCRIDLSPREASARRD